MIVLEEEEYRGWSSDSTMNARLARTRLGLIDVKFSMSRIKNK
jgi:hypothetical protein